MAYQHLFLVFLIISTSLLWGSFVSVEGRFIVKKGSISVVSPYDIRSKHDAAIGNFGVPDYGGLITGSVVYPGKGKADGCKPFDGDQPYKAKSNRPTILLLDRGDCFFTLKIWNGQQAGAAAVLVADNIDEPLMDTPESSYADGFIKKINIPSALELSGVSIRGSSMLSATKTAAAPACCPFQIFKVKKQSGTQIR